MEAYVKDLGTIIEEPNVTYADGRKAIEKRGADFSKMTAKNTAYARNVLGKDHEFSQNGNWIIEEVVYNLKGFENPVLLMVPGPIFHNPKIATDCHKKNKKFELSDERIVFSEDMKQYGKNWEEAISALARNDAAPLKKLAFKLPAHKTFEIPVEELLGLDTEKLSDPAYFKKLSKEAQVAVVLWKDQTRAYAEKVLKPAGIEKVPFWLVSKDDAKSRKSAFSMELWFWDVDDGSLLDGDGDLDYLNCVRGVRESAEGNAQKFEGAEEILAAIKAGKGFEYKGKVYAPIDKKALDF
jgi:hypothetical protein